MQVSRRQLQVAHVAEHGQACGGSDLDGNLVVDVEDLLSVLEVCNVFILALIYAPHDMLP